MQNVNINTNKTKINQKDNIKEIQIKKNKIKDDITQVYYKWVFKSNLTDATESVILVPSGRSFQSQGAP